MPRPPKASGSTRFPALNLVLLHMARMAAFLGLNRPTASIQTAPPPSSLKTRSTVSSVLAEPPPECWEHQPCLPQSPPPPCLAQDSGSAGYLQSTLGRSSEGSRRMPPERASLWQKDYFELVISEKLQAEGKLKTQHKLSFGKENLNL